MRYCYLRLRRYADINTRQTTAHTKPRFRARDHRRIDKKSEGNVSGQQPKCSLSCADADRFLWVIFQLQDLCDATSDHAVRRTLSNLPEGLYETYDRKLAKIEAGETSTLVARTFKWITAALRPLSLEEIREGIAFDQDETCWNQDKLSHPEKIIGSCQNLVILHEDGRLSFAHHTVQSFLLSRRSPSLRSPLTFDLKAALFYAAMVCVTYLCFTDFEAQIVRRPQEIVQPTGVVNSGGLLHLTRILGISDIWFSLPYKLLGGSPRQHSTPIEVKWATSSPRGALAPMLTEKYKFLDYAIQYWLWHTKALPAIIDREVGQLRKWSDADERFISLQHFGLGGNYTTLVRFSELALERVMVFNHLLWDAQSNYLDLPFDAMFRWALENAHVPLLALLEAPSRGPPLRSYLHRYFQNSHDILRTPCIKGEIEVLQFLVQYCRENNMDFTEYLHGEYLSWCASLNGHTSIVKLLLREGVSVNARTERPRYAPNIDGFSSATALELAVLNGHNDVLDVLLTNGASIDQWNEGGLHPLHYAPNTETVGLLLRKGADVNINALYIDGEFNALPIHLAAAAGRTAVVEKLLSSGAKANQLGPHKRTPLQYTCDSATARFLLEYDCGLINNANLDGETCLISAASKGSSDLVKLFCDQGASTDAVDRYGQTALHKACIWGHAETVRVLLANTCQQINSQDILLMAPLDHAVKSRHADIASILQQYGALISKFCFLELHGAADRGDTKMVDLLLGLGIPVDSFNREGKTALRYAVEHQYVSLVQLLIERHAKVNLRSPFNGRNSGDHSTALIAGSISGHVGIVQMLLKAGANCDMHDSDKRAALFYAVKFYHYDIARLLIAHNAEPTAFAYSSTSKTIRDGRTPLQILEDRYESTDREMLEILKSYTEQRDISKTSVDNEP